MLIEKEGEARSKGVFEVSKKMAWALFNEMKDEFHTKRGHFVLLFSREKIFVFVKEFW